MMGNRTATHAKLMGASILTIWPILIVSFLSGQTLPPVAIVPTATISQGDLVAAQRGDVKAQLKIGRAYYEGTAGKRNYPEAYRWFTEAERSGSAEGKAWLGSCYLLGYGVQIDVETASTLISASAKTGNPVGERFLGFMYESGQGMPQSYSEAIRWYQASSEQGDGNAFDKLGLLYLYGRGAHRNPSIAFQLFLQGADTGDSWDQLHLAQMYRSGHIFLPGSSSITDGLLPRQETSQQNPISSIAVSSTLSGKSTPLTTSSVETQEPDYQKAYQLFLLSSNQGNKVAAFYIAQMYEAGEGVEQSYSKAFYYYSFSAVRKYAPAQLAIGQSYALGRGTQQDLPRAYVSYRLAAEQGDTVAKALLSDLTVHLTTDELSRSQQLYSSSK